MAAETVELDKDAFMRLVTEGHLQVEGPSAGYLYTGKQGRNGWELYKTWAGIVEWDLISPKIQVGANPGAGLDAAVITVPAGKRWLLIAAYFTIVTSVAVADRYPYLTVTQQSGSAYTISAQTPVTASLTQGFTFVAGAGAGGYVAAGGGLTVPIGMMTELIAGGTLQMKVANIQAADDSSATYWFYKEADV